jgi:hypothetical protein
MFVTIDLLSLKIKLTLDNVTIKNKTILKKKTGCNCPIDHPVNEINYNTSKQKLWKLLQKTSIIKDSHEGFSTPHIL